MARLIEQMYFEYLDLLAQNSDLRRQVAAVAAQHLDNRPKLGKGEVTQIREMHRAGVKMTDIADSFDVNKSTISRIVKGVYHK